MIVNTFHTSIFKKEKWVRSEKICTLKDFLAMGRLKPGQSILIGEISKDSNGREYSCNTEVLYVGNCTPYHQPSMTDAEIGWDNNDSRMSKYILEVYENY